MTPFRVRLALVVGLLCLAVAYGILALEEFGYISERTESLWAGSLASFGIFLLLFFVIFPVLTTLVFRGSFREYVAEYTPLIDWFTIRKRSS